MDTTSPPIPADASRPPGDPAALAPRADLQRVVLSELVILSARCAAAESDLEREHQTAVEQAQTSLNQRLSEIEQQQNSAREAAERTHQDFLERIGTQYEADLDRLRSSDQSARQRIEAEKASIERGVSRTLQQATWMADSLLEGIQDQIRDEEKRAREEEQGRNELLAALEDQAATLMHRFHASWESGESEPLEDDEPQDQEGGTDDPTAGGSGDLEPTRPADPEAARLPVSFVDRCVAAQHVLEELEQLRLPRLFVGVMPFMILLLGIAGAAAAAYLLAGAGEPQWQGIAMAGGGALVLMLVLGAILWIMAQSKLADVAAVLRHALDEAHRTARLEAERSARDRQGRLARATQRRNAEVQAAQSRLDPVTYRANQGYIEAMQTFQSEHDRLLPKIEAQRQRGLEEAEAWLQQQMQEADEQYERERAAAQQHHQSRMSEIQARYERDWAALEERWTSGLAQLQAPIEADSRTDSRLFPDWNDPRWQNWTPPRTFAAAIRFGELRVDLQKLTDKVPCRLVLPESFSVPAVLAFPSRASLLIHTDHAGREQAIRTLQTVMVRLLTSLPPGRVRFTLIDPVGLGRSFAGFMHLADHDEALVGSRIWSDSDHIDSRLADLTEHMETVIQKYLRNEFETIDAYNQQAGELAEPYQVLVIADFPINFTEAAARRLNSIASTGARCGVCTLIARDMRQSLPGGIHLDELEAHSVNLVPAGGEAVSKVRDPVAGKKAGFEAPAESEIGNREPGMPGPQHTAAFTWRDEVFRQFPLVLDPPPPEQMLTRILHSVGREARIARRVEVPFAAIAPRGGEMWSGSTREHLEVPIGRSGATRLQTLRLGRGVAQHGLIAGKTGSGKSTLLHVLITNLAMWYSPEEVEFYLVDFKKGVEFKAYATHQLPHARAIAVESDREFGLSVLQRVDAELVRRGALFRQAGAQELDAYRQANGKPLPRTLLIVDEFQEFFSEDDRLSQEAGLLLDRLVRQGRAFGVHVLLGSQTIGGTSGLARSTLGQMAVRIALQTSEADSQVILGDNNLAARLLSRPGEAIYNDAGGLVEGNSPFQVAWLPDHEREKRLQQVLARTAEWQSGRDAERKEETVVFEGNVPADIRQNKELVRLFERGAGLSPVMHAGGTPVPHSTRPAQPAAVRAWVGEPVSIKEPTAVTFRRQSGSHLLLVGQDEEAALGVMVAALVSLSAQHPPDRAAFHILDGTPADSPLAGTLDRFASALPHRTTLVDYRAVPDGVAAIAAELQARQGMTDPEPVSVYVLVHGLQRYRVLRRQEESFSFSASAEEAKPGPDRQFADLLREGPPLGMHVLAWADTLATVERTLDRTGLREIDHRVLFQMSATDSSNLIDSPLANKLGPNRAIAFSEEQGTIEKFRPYAVPPADWLGHLQQLFQSRTLR